MWDEEKERIFNQVESGTFDNIILNAPLGENWWKAINEKDEVCGFGWGMFTSSDFEISIAVDENNRQKSLGTQIIEELEVIARGKGIYKMTALIQATNPIAIKMVEWLYNKGYELYFENVLRSDEFAKNLARKQIIDLELIKELF